MESIVAVEPKCRAPRRSPRADTALIAPDRAIYRVSRHWVRLVNGISQLVGLRQSNWALRLVTGILFALALAWWLYPRLDSGFAVICDTLEARFRGLAAEGRAAPL